MARVFGEGNPRPPDIYMVPTLGVTSSMVRGGGPPEDPEVTRRHNRLLCAFASQLGIEFCPTMYFLTRCMLYAVSDEALVYSIIQGLIGSRRDTYFPRSLAQDFAFAKCFHSILAQKVGSVVLKPLAVPTKDLLQLYRQLLDSFFMWILPQEDVVKLIDCYVGEGPKILIRFGIALVSLALRSRPSTAGAITTASDVEAALVAAVSGPGNKYSFAALAKSAFQIPSLARKYMHAEVQRQREALEASDLGKELYPDPEQQPRGLWHNPRFTSASRILAIVLNKEAVAGEGAGVVGGGDLALSVPPAPQAPQLLSRAGSMTAPGAVTAALHVSLARLAGLLPVRLLQFDFSLLYASTVHGQSLDTLYRRTAAAGPCLVLLYGQPQGSRTVAPVVVGAYSKPGVKVKEGKGWLSASDGAIFQLCPSFAVGSGFSSSQFVLATGSLLWFGGQEHSAHTAIQLHAALDTFDLSAKFLHSLGTCEDLLEHGGVHQPSAAAAAPTLQPPTGAGAVPTATRSPLGGPVTIGRGFGPSSGTGSLTFDAFEVEVWGFVDRAGTVQ